MITRRVFTLQQNVVSGKRDSVLEGLVFKVLNAHLRTVCDVHIYIANALEIWHVKPSSCVNVYEGSIFLCSIRGKSLKAKKYRSETNTYRVHGHLTPGKAQCN